MAADPSAGRAEGLDAQVAGDLYRRHHRRVYAFCLAQLRNADEAADATQTTFVRALAALRRGVDPTLELPWLFTIARNVCRSRWEARKRRRHLEVVVDPGDLAELAAAPEPVDTLAGLDDALASLPELQRRAVVLRDWQGLSYKEIADELGVTLAATETLIFRGRSALARELSGDHELSGNDAPKRRAGLSSLLGLFKTGLLGGGSAAKVVIGTVAVVGVVAAGTHELSQPAPRPAHAPVVVTPSSATSASVVSAKRVVANAPVRAAHRPAAKRVVHPGARRSVVVRSVPVKGAKRNAPGSAPGVTAPSSVPTPGPAAPAAQPAPTPAATTPTAAPAPTPAAAPKAPAPASAPAPVPTPTATAPTPPPATTTTVTAAVTPVVTQVTDTVQPVVTTVTDTVAPVVTTATDTVAPVVTTVTQTLPPLPSPPPVHLP